jgi:hypothetical protein
VPGSIQKRLETMQGIDIVIEEESLKLAECVKGKTNK